MQFTAFSSTTCPDERDGQPLYYHRGNGVGELAFRTAFRFTGGRLKEALFEPLLRSMRIGKILPVLQRYPSCRMLDIGCGWDAHLLKTAEPYIAQGVGIDARAPEICAGKVCTQKLALDGKLPFADESFDVVTMLAVLEHLDRPFEIAEEIWRVLAPGGCLVLTVPSRAARPVLEFLAYRLGLVSEAEIRDHKMYYNRSDLTALFDRTRLTIEQHHYFQLGMNNFCLLRK